MKAQINIFVDDEGFVTIISHGDDADLYNMLRRFGYKTTKNKNAIILAAAALTETTTN